MDRKFEYVERSRIQKLQHPAREQQQRCCGRQILLLPTDFAAVNRPLSSTATRRSLEQTCPASTDREDVLLFFEKQHMRYRPCRNDRQATIWSEPAVNLSQREDSIQH